ncbi:hypothetical protein FRC02_011231 [Tulasnella sp. 418]|nr:hypothetical protein FRC02_011231 [Tulasnella sp. 418]
MAMQFWKPGTVAPGSSLDRASEIEGNVVQSAPVAPSLGIQAQRERLPIFKHRDRLLYCVEKYGVMIVVGQTGCGKTTQLPQYLYEAGWASAGNVIACTQPRRVAATSVATRVASEVGTLLGDEVGYTIRFEDVSDKDRTRIKYMTDGMLFRETMVDPLLSKYSVIMIDEAHERSIYTDLLLGVLKKVRRKRPGLRLIVSSATLDASSFLEYFTEHSPSPDEEAIIVSLEGRMYPVEIAYLEEPCSDYVSEAVRVIWDIHLKQGPGDILVFLTGREEIDRCLSELAELLPKLPRGAPRLDPLPLHAGLPTDEQLRVFETTERGTRKVVISTNIAEASVTIDGIKFVVDCGFVKVRTYNPTTSLSSLTPIPTSLASATQRAGRAGRTSPGICFRLYPESVLQTLPRTTAPEIVRTDLTTPILQLKSLGIDDLVKFEWVTNPPAEAVLRALETLVAAGMIGPEDGRLTMIGEKVAECPVEVGIARMLFNSRDYKCGEEMLTLAAVTSVQASAESSKNCGIVTNSPTGRRFGLPLDSCEGDAKRLRQCLVSGYWRNGARWMPDGTFRAVRGDTVLHIHPSSVMFTRKPRTGWVIFHEMEETKKTHIRIITEIEPDWLLEYGHKYFDKRTGEERHR